MVSRVINLLGLFSIFFFISFSKIKSQIFFSKFKKSKIYKTLVCFSVLIKNIYSPKFLQIKVLFSSSKKSKLLYS